MSTNGKKLVAKLLFVPLFFVILTSFASINAEAYRRANADIIVAEPVIVTRPPIPQRGDLYVFLDAVAYRESSGRQDVVNQIGMLGKYQFSPKTLWRLGAQFKVTRDEFLGNAALQDSAMVQYLKDNRLTLRDIIIEYDGSWYNGIYITESGLLAGAHLVGPHGLMAYFNPDYTVRGRNGRIIRPRTIDGNGTSVEEYIERFSGYDLDNLD